MKQPSGRDLAEDYHVASRNLAVYKRHHSAHQIHYAPHVQQLMSTSNLVIADRPRVPLSRDLDLITMTVREAITTRTSGRDYGEDPLDPRTLATLLHLANGVRAAGEAAGRSWIQRNVPSSGNLGSIEVFPIVLRVDGIDPGIYHYDAVTHELVLLRSGAFAGWLRHEILFQIEFSQASVALVLTSAIGRLTAKYGPRGYRLGMLDTGHVSNNVYLACTALGLQVCATAGFIDERLDDALGLDGLEVASTLVILVGTASRTGS